MENIRLLYSEMLDEKIKEEKEIKKNIFNFSDLSNLEKIDEDIKENVTKIIVKETNYRESLKQDIKNKLKENKLEVKS